MASGGRPAQGYEMVMAVTLASFALHHVYMPTQVARARAKYGICYPDLYATKDNCKNKDDAHKFNCIQRAHQCSLEFHGPVLVLLNLAGLQHPATTAIAGTAYVVGRIVYFECYSTGKPLRRAIGAPLYIGAIAALMGIVGKTVYVWASKKN